VLAATREVVTLLPHSESSKRSFTEKSMSAKSGGNNRGWSRMLRSRNIASNSAEDSGACCSDNDGLMDAPTPTSDGI